MEAVIICVGLLFGGVSNAWVCKKCLNNSNKESLPSKNSQSNGGGGRNSCRYGYINLSPTKFPLNKILVCTSVFLYIMVSLYM